MEGAVNLKGDELQFGFFGWRQDGAEDFDFVEGCTDCEATGVGEEVADAHAGVEGVGAGGLDGTGNADFADVFISGVVVDVQLVAGLEFHGTGCFKLDADVLHFGGDEEVAAEDVSYGVNAFFEAAGVFDGLADGDAVVKGKAFGEGFADLPVDGDGGDIAVGGLVHDVYDVAALKGEVWSAFDAWEGYAQEFDGFIGAHAFYEEDIGFSLVVGFGVGEQFAERGVAAQVEAAGVIDATKNFDVGVDGFVDGFDADNVAVGQSYFGFVADDFGEVPFEEFFFAVDVSLYLDEFGVDVHGEAACVFDQVGDGFTFHHFVLHGAFDGAFDGDDAFGDGYEDDVVVLEVEAELNGWVVHEVVQVDVFAGGAANELDVTHGTEIGDAAGCAEGVEG